MPSVEKILEHIGRALNAVRELEKKIASRSSPLEHDEIVWEAYRNCEAAIFLLKIEMNSVDEFDDSRLEFNQDYPDYNIFVAEEHIEKAVAQLERKDLKTALAELRAARNILAEAFARARRGKIDRIRENFRREKTNI